MGGALTRTIDPLGRRKQSRARTPTTMTPNTPQSPASQLVFGRPLRDLVEEEKARGPYIKGPIRYPLPEGVDPQSIPSILVHTIQSMRELEALEVEGIFRVPGSFIQFERLRNQINSGDTKNIALGTLDVHILATLVKQFIATLPDPITTVQLYEHWISAARHSNSSERLRALIEVYECMQEPNKSCMKFLFEFLADIHQKRDINKMGAHVLATAFGPSVLRDDGKNPTKMFLDMRDVHVAVSTMIEFFNEVFNSSNPVEDEQQIDNFVAEEPDQLAQYYGDGEGQLDENFNNYNEGNGEADTGEDAPLEEPVEQSAESTRYESDANADLEMQRKIAMLPPPPSRQAMDMLQRVHENEQPDEVDDEDWT